MKKNETAAVILAGGSGTRLWPLSRQLFPKQFINILDGKSLFEATIARVAPLVGEGGIIAVVNRDHAWGAAHHILKPYQLIIEPEGRNTAPAIGLAAKFAMRAGGDPVLIVLPSDQIITNVPAFRRMLKTAADEARKGHIITLGIKPTHPETGYGYMQFSPAETRAEKSLPVRRFVEKPDFETAKRYLEAGDYLWNCGIFVFKASVILSEIKRHLPRVHSLLNEIEKRAFSGGAIKPKELARVFHKMPSVSIDYGVMEKSRLVRVMACGDIGWNDLGSWLCLHQISKKDARGNVLRGEVMASDCRGSMIHSEGRLVAAIGLKDTAIIETADAVLACPLSRSQEVKKIVAELRLKRRSQADEHLTVRRPWGAYTLLENAAAWKVKRLEINPGQKISLQFHRKRSEHWTIIGGEAEVTKGDLVLQLREKSSIDIPPCTAHCVRNRTEKILTIIEVQSGPYLGEDDIIRLEDDYGRG
ncbi:MAG: mannose-1-phosphate guanylyltransferase/mannose-6-phosphate isomerase [Elusimicrobiales bacterium]|nr:mannose-1-phosphate guanylyltransferase/mannose-6-phosphate isomerase [Elusimicrobiales bacterium]